jgi:IMP dehydrogenase
MQLKTGYELSDVLLIPKYSTVNSRANVDLSTKIGNLELKIPIIASPMPSIVGVELIKELGKLGGIGILHRFYANIIQRAYDTAELEHNASNFGVAVGIKDAWYHESVSAGASIILIDVANGYLDSVLETTAEIANYISKGGFNCLLMSGNVVTWEGAKNLANYGADLIRVGIGSGQLCTTRKQTGIGFPQFSAIQNCSYVEYPYKELGRGLSVYKSEWSVVADGGIKTSGDAVKALAAGADLIMCGTLFANCFESSHNGHIEGSASREFQEQFYGEVKKSVEGIQQDAEKKISLEDFIKEFAWNMRSGFSYCNAKNIEELHQNAEFVTCSSGSIR